MTQREEAEKVWRNLKGDCFQVAHYLVARCGDFIYDHQREAFIAEFLRAAPAAHQERTEPPDGNDDRDFIERRWREGVREAEYCARCCSLDPTPIANPYDPTSLAGTWWLRGYESMRAILRQSEEPTAPARAAEWQPLIDRIVSEWAIKAVEYARRQVIPNAGGAESGTPYERGLMSRLSATYRDGYLAALDAVREALPPCALTGTKEK